MQVPFCVSDFLTVACPFQSLGSEAIPTFGNGAASESFATTCRCLGMEKGRARILSPKPKLTFNNIRGNNRKENQIQIRSNSRSELLPLPKLALNSSAWNLVSLDLACLNKGPYKVILLMKKSCNKTQTMGKTTYQLVQDFFHQQYHRVFNASNLIRLVKTSVTFFEGTLDTCTEPSYLAMGFLFSHQTAQISSRFHLLFWYQRRGWLCQLSLQKRQHQVGVANINWTDFLAIIPDLQPRFGSDIPLPKFTPEPSSDLDEG